MAEKPTHGFRKVPTVNPLAASAFVGREEAVVAAVPAPEPLRSVPPPAPQAVAPAPTRTRRKTLVRADGRELRKQTIYFEPELSTRLAVHCAQSGKDISEVVQAAVAQYLSSGR